MAAMPNDAPVEFAVFIIIAIFVLLYSLRKAGQVASGYLAERGIKGQAADSGYSDLAGQNPGPQNTPNNTNENQSQEGGDESK